MTIHLRAHHPLTTHNTFRIGARARWFYTLTDIRVLPALIQHPVYQQYPALWIGNGSNLLFRTNPDQFVIQMATRGIRLIAETADSVLIEVAAGEPWTELVPYTLKQGWYGLENLSLIPSSVGAAPVQNIGAYGVEAKDVIEQVICADLQNQAATVSLKQTECQFGYRSSLFKQDSAKQLLVTAVRFRLHKNPQQLKMAYGDIQQELKQQNCLSPTPVDVAQAITSLRRKKLPDPDTLGNAGSFFKNPVVPLQTLKSLQKHHPAIPHYPVDTAHCKLAAGWLIDQAGLKGFRQGDAGVHTHQALVLVNHGQASGEDIWQLASTIQQKVHTRFNVWLEPEIIII